MEKKNNFFMRRDLIKYRCYKEYQLPKKTPNIKSTQSISSLVLYSEKSKLHNYNEEEKH